MKELSHIYSDFITTLKYDNIPSQVINQAKKLVLDLVGVSLAGYKLMEFPRMVVDYFSKIGGVPEATIIQKEGKFPAIHAAFANGVCAHSLDMDDGHRLGALHPGSPIIPTAMAAAELGHTDTKEFLTGIVVGYEVMCRIGKSINPSSLNRGFHATGITGVFGAVACAASILKLSQEETSGAIGLAGLQASGLLQVNHDVEGAKVKSITPGRAAQSGILSAIFAKKGARGPIHIFEGEDGFFKAFTDQMDESFLTQNLGKEFELCQVYIKLYAACRHAHACIDAALLAFQQSRKPVEEIDSILIETYPVAIRLAGIKEATTPSAGRFSIPFSVALALIKGDAGAEQYSLENINNPRIQELAKRVTLRVSPLWEKVYPQRRGATVRIKDRNGREWVAEVPLAKGEPENPALWEEIYRKFYNNATLVLSEQEASQLGRVIMELEKRDLQEMMTLISKSAKAKSE
jgi:2-methylcitrate dehydratase PrpD